MNELKEKYIVIKIEDLKYINSGFKIAMLKNDLNDIEAARKAEGKKINEYLVFNKDEPYADLVEKLILKEITARDIIETIARNCTAWDTSKDKKEGLLPEVTMTNEHLYEIFTGKKYNLYEACRLFNIGES